MSDKQDTLEKFGAVFQTKVLYLLIKDHTFVQQIFDIVDPKFFEASSRQWIAKTIIEYFKEYHALPTPTVFRTEVDKIDNDVHKLAVEQELKNVMTNASDSDLDYVKNRFLKFCKNQTLKDAILKSVDLLEAQDFDAMRVVLTDAFKAGIDRDVGHDWKKDVDIRLKADPRDTVATPWSCLNKVMDGGLAGGELGVVAAPSGAGKSWLLAALGVKAMQEGKKVMHFTLELNDCYTGLRYDTLFSKIETQKLRENYDKVKSIIMNVPGEIIIKYFPSKTVNAYKLLSHIQQAKSFGFEPDIVIVDYGDLLRSNSSQEARWIEMGAIYEELRSLAGELFIPVWTASQTHRSSIDEEVIQADKIAESYGKIMVADFVMSLSRTLNDKTTNTGRVHLIKNRFGVDGITFPATVNVIEGNIEIYDEHSSEGQRAIAHAQGGQGQVNKMLHKRFMETQKTNNLG